MKMPNFCVLLFLWSPTHAKPSCSQEQQQDTEVWQNTHLIATLWWHTMVAFLRLLKSSLSIVASMQHFILLSLTLIRATMVAWSKLACWSVWNFLSLKIPSQRENRIDNMHDIKQPKSWLAILSRNLSYLLPKHSCMTFLTCSLIGRLWWYALVVLGPAMYLQSATVF